MDDFEGAQAQDLTRRLKRFIVSSFHVILTKLHGNVNKIRFIYRKQLIRTKAQDFQCFTVSHKYTHSM